MRSEARRATFISQIFRWCPPAIPGKARLARYLLGSSIDVQEIAINGRDGCTYISPSLREPIAFYLLIDGVYEIEAMDFLLKRLTSGDVFVDIGANIGTFTLPAAQKVGSTGCVVAIEPSPRVFPYLERNIAFNEFKNVHLMRCAAANCDGETTPFYEAPVEKFGMGSLGAQFHTSPVLVLCRTLDQILNQEQIEKVDVIKVDVEGFEVAVFEGAQKLLTGDNAPLILFEFCDWAENRVPGRQVGDAQRLLREWDYKIWRLKYLLRNGSPLSDVVTTGFDTLVAIRNS